MATRNSETVRINIIEHVQDTVRVQFAWQDAAGRLYDLSNYLVEMELRQKQSDPSPLLKYSSAVQEVTNGIHPIKLNVSDTVNIWFEISAEQTQALGAGEFYYFVTTKDTEGFVNTLIVGKLLLKVR